MKRGTEGSFWKRVLVMAAANVILVSGASAATQYKVLHQFANTPASSPESAMVADASGNLYGTSTFSAPDSCGDAGCGTVFRLKRLPAGGWGYKVIYRFHGSDGERPVGSMIFGANGHLYGMTYLGGVNHSGTVYELFKSGSSWKERVLHQFGSSGDAYAPMGALVFDTGGNLYGTAAYGGANFHGAVFKLTPTDPKSWKESVIYSFTGGSDGSAPSGNLVLDLAGNLYGVTGAGGAFNQGVVFAVNSSSGSETVLYSFTGGTDGGVPAGGVIFDAPGNLYGTTQLGGLNSCNGGSGCGTVFELAPSGGNWIFSVLHAFEGADGTNPYASLILDHGGNLYGTAPGGGGGGNNGLVFKLSQSGGVWSETVLHAFNQQDGSTPYGGLILDQQGFLYGGTAYGGGGGFPSYGVLFRIKP